MSHSFKAGQAVTFRDRFGGGKGTVSEVQHTSKGDFIVISIPADDGGEPFTRKVRPVSVSAA